MKIVSFRIENFRGIRYVEARNLGSTIIIAGQNGSGKSAIFDAIRLMKSVYGGYQANEWQQFFGEFQIQLQGRYKNISGIFNDPKKSISIRASISLHDDERAYISANIDELLLQTMWQGQMPDAFDLGSYRQRRFSPGDRGVEEQFRREAVKLRPDVLAELAKDSIEIGIDISPEEDVATIDSNVAAIAFSNFRPREIGLIDFHGAQRHYNRELLQGINLNLQQAEQNQSQHALYNYNNKYNNVKSEMAASFISELLSEQATGKSPDAEGSINSSLKELFATFFPDKEFLGPQPTKEGSLRFPVRIKSGGEHDIDDLSSGEKEILYGYVRMRSSAPRYAIVLIDEPELHLNPRLIRSLPEFYRRNLGELLDNQLWLVTHSDSLIREAVGKPGFNVFHMQPPGLEPDNQLRAMSVSQELDAALTDLVGDLAAYRPGGRCIILEGDGDAEFDRRVVLSLFAEELEGANLISSANKSRVRSLHRMLAEAYDKGRLGIKFYAVTDKDSESAGLETTEAILQYSWDVYHIENYLLDSKTIAEVANILNGADIFTSDSVDDDLRNAAAEVVPELIEHKVRGYINGAMVECLRLKTSGDTGVVNGLIAAARASRDRLVKVVDELALQVRAEEIEVDTRTGLQEALNDGTWRALVPGRPILRKFVSVRQLGQYERFRNLVLARMADNGLKPAGMAKVIQQIRSN